MVSTQLDLSADLIDVCDIIARVEELREEREESDIDPAAYGGPADTWKDEREELAQLESLLAEVQGLGGDEQWEGEWYPVTLIRESYFESYMDEMLEDIGDIPKNIPSYMKIVIDYDALQMDYTSVDIGDNTYWTR